MTHPLCFPPKWSPGLAYQALSMYSVEKYVKRCLLVLANFHHLLFTSCSHSRFTVLEATKSWVGPGLALYSVSIPQLRALDLDSVLVLYQMGHSKVFFIAGVLAQLEGDTKPTGSEYLEKIWGKGWFQLWCICCLIPVQLFPQPCRNIQPVMTYCLPQGPGPTKSVWSSSVQSASSSTVVVTVHKGDKNQGAEEEDGGRDHGTRLLWQVQVLRPQ